jgi:plasmid stability protein
MKQVAHCMMRAERGQNAGCPDDAAPAEHGRGAEAEHRAILEQALRPASTGFWHRAAALHAATRGRIKVPSEELIRQDRDEQ